MPSAGESGVRAMTVANATTPGGGHIREIGAHEEIGIILYSTINGLATLADSGLVDAARSGTLTEAAVQQFLTGNAP